MSTVISFVPQPLHCQTGGMVLRHPRISPPSQDPGRRRLECGPVLACPGPAHNLGDGALHPAPDSRCGVYSCRGRRSWIDVVEHPPHFPSWCSCLQASSHRRPCGARHVAGCLFQARRHLERTPFELVALDLRLGHPAGGLGGVGHLDALLHPLRRSVDDHGAHLLNVSPSAAPSPKPEHTGAGPACGGAKRTL